MLYEQFATPIYLADDPDRDLAPLAAELHGELARGIRGSQYTGVPAAGAEERELADAFALAKRETHDRLQLRGGAIGAAIGWILDAAEALLDQLGVPPAAPGQRRLAAGNAWASFYRAGDHHSPHIHPDCLFSAVLAVQVPACPPPQGCLTLWDPRPNIAYHSNPFGLFADAQILRLRPGQIIVFPAWLRHSVEPFRGEGTRITLSANLVASAPGAGAPLTTPA